MHIMTTEGLQPLDVVCVNHIFELMSWNPLSKAWEKGGLQPQLRYVRTDDHAEPSFKTFDAEAYRISNEKWLKNIRREIADQRAARLGQYQD